MPAKKLSHKSGGRSSAASWSHFNKPIPDDGNPHGNSRRPGDASPEVQQLVIDSLLKECAEQGLGKKDAAYVLAIARHESGFNPDAASPRSSATGIGQFIDRTGQAYNLDEKNRFDIDANAKALVEHYVDTKALVKSRGLGPEHIYQIHHDGPSGNSGGLEISKREVMPYVTAYRDSPLLASFNNTKDSARTQVATAEPEARQAPAAASEAVDKAPRSTVTAAAQLEQPESLSPLASASVGPNRPVVQVTANAGENRQTLDQALQELAAFIPAAGSSWQAATAEAPPRDYAAATAGPDQPAARETSRSSELNKEEILAAGKAQDLHPSAVAAVIAHRTGEEMSAEAVMQAWNSSPTMTPGSPGSDRAFAQGTVGGPGQPESASAQASLSPLDSVNPVADRTATQVALDGPTTVDPALGEQGSAPGMASVQDALLALSSGELAPSGEVASVSVEKGNGTFFEADNALEQNLSSLSASSGFDRQAQAAEERDQAYQVASAEMELDMSD